ncbi:hypothetical protein HanOQP8_Chr16g0632481 [Helianthus annuus]|nr:hypothetical protein HanHA89_Chr16g0677801 [Helianthus annuus]KAJ0646199.1 hypothetical protein HanOQP8_Chr16g0632481 [Helianthus annuus]
MVTLTPREGLRWLRRDTRPQSRHATELGNPVAARDRGTTCRFCLFRLFSSKYLKKHVI